MGSGPLKNTGSVIGLQSLKFNEFIYIYNFHCKILSEDPFVPSKVEYYKYASINVLPKYNILVISSL